MQPSQFAPVLAEVSKCFQHFFSETKGFAMLKLAVFTTLLVFLGRGFFAEFSGGINKPAGAAQGRVEVPGPDWYGVTVALIAFLSVLGANLYLMHRRKVHEIEKLKIAADPRTPPEVRARLLSS